MSERATIQMVPYPTIAGQSFAVGSIGQSDLRLRIQSTTEDECREYAAQLETLGYRQCAAKEISAGLSYSYNKNLYYAYQNDTSNVFIFWDANARTVFITVQPLSTLNTDMDSHVSYETAMHPTFTHMQPRGGMSYVIQLENGEFVLVDGGLKDADSGDGAGERLYAFLKEHTPSHQPKVALWIFTHPHKDHIGLAAEFLVKYGRSVEVKAFAYQFPDCDKITVAMEDTSVVKQGIADLETAIQTFYSGATVYTLHTGQSYYFPGMELEVLYSLDDTYPYPYLSFNDTSAAFRMKFRNGRTVLFLGDSQNEACKRMADRYGDYLKSDFLQLAHHGLIGGDKRLYQLIDPEICSWATPKTRFLGEKPNQRYQWCLGEGGCDYNAYLRDESIRKRVHCHNGEITTMDI